MDGVGQRRQIIAIPGDYDREEDAARAHDAEALKRWYVVLGSKL